MSDRLAASIIQDDALICERTQIECGGSNPQQALDRALEKKAANDSQPEKISQFIRIASQEETRRREAKFMWLEVPPGPGW